ncbi:MAG: pyridoxal-phosphate dependent enzyme [Bdellovibrionales bacterium]|nr:pyridoxal-phosphate dependent enzyme [Bdellovibrionales bacterium]
MTDSSMATVYAKMENLNPAGSVKDRMAVHMINCAEKEGLIKPGCMIVESTSGNTGLGLAMACAVRGYRITITIPDKMSQEKIDMLKAYGAEVIVCPTNVDHDAPESYVSIAKKIAKETPNSFYTDQYFNMHNPEAHYLTTGPEIWADTDGKIDALVGGIGTGGTISGAAKYLREKAAEAGRTVQVVCPDPVGSMYFDAFNKRDIREPKVYKVEGIGHDFMVGTLDFNVIDEVMEVSDRDSFVTARRLTREEGIFCGGSTGTAVYGALEVAKRLGPGKIVVVILCDNGDRYIGKLYNDVWMKDNGYVNGDDRLGFIRDVLQFKGNAVEFAGIDESIASVAQRMNTLGISQMPVRNGEKGVKHMVHESDLLRSLLEGQCKPQDPVSSVAAELQGIVAVSDSVAKLERIFEQNNVAVVFDGSTVSGIISKIDLVRYLASRK